MESWVIRFLNAVAAARREWALDEWRRDSIVIQEAQLIRAERVRMLAARERYDEKEAAL